MRMDINDDMADAKPPFKVVAVIPVHERLQLLPLTIGRLYKKNGLHKVICVGDGIAEKAISIEAGALWVPHQNKPLGAKWNAGFMAAKELNPDAIVFVGSSDWLCDQWLTIMKPHLDRHQMVGVPGCHFIDIKQSIRVVNWKGYTGPRADETIGIGRILSREVLDKINWEPFDSTKDNSMDRAMKDKCAKHGYKDVFIHDDRLVCASISTHRWVNKHQFETHWNNLMPSEKILECQPFLNQHFPEAYQLLKSFNS